MKTGNTQILYFLQTSLINTRLSSLTADIRWKNRLLLYHILICRIYVQPPLCKCWETLKASFAHKGPYEISIEGMRLQLRELQTEDLQAQKVRLEKLETRLKKGWEKIKEVLHHQALLYIPAMIWTELICLYHNDYLAWYFKIKKTKEMIGQKCY